jgi:type II secretory pathway predicted ATPase ExeA
VNRIVENLRSKIEVLNPEVFLKPGSKEKPKINIKYKIKLEGKNMDKKTMEFFNFKVDPFLSPAIIHPDKQWVSDEAASLLEKILYAAEVKTFFTFIGGVGTGKSNLMRKVRHELTKLENLIVINIPTLSVSHMDDGAMVSAVIKGISKEAKPFNKISERGQQLAEKLDECELSNIRIIILIDDAHKLPPEGLRALRILLESSDNVSIVLAAQPSITDLLLSSGLSEVNERLDRQYINSFRLKNSNYKTVGSYIKHKLSIAGSDKYEEIFPADVIKRIGEIVCTPLNINNLCTAVMADTAKINSGITIDIEILEAVIQRSIEE